MQRVQQRCHVLIDERVDHVEAGDRLRPPAFHAAGQRRDAEAHGKEQLQQDGEPEAGNGEARDGDEAQPVIHPGIAPQRADDAERHAYQCGDHHRDKRELQCRRQPAKQILRDRAPGINAAAHVAAEDGLHVAQELNVQRLVQTQPRAQLRDGGGGSILAGGKCRRIGRDDVRDDEDRGTTCDW